MTVPPAVAERVTALLGPRVVGGRKATGGFSIAERWSADLADGRRVFAKLATTDDIAGRLRAEHERMTEVPAEFRCEIIAWEDGDRPLLVVEDHSRGFWPPPWRPGDVERVLETLERLATVPVPSGFPPAEASAAQFRGWQAIADDPAPFLSVGICSSGWLDRSLPALVEAEDRFDLAGDDLVHLDVRSDNLCLLDDRVVLVDWNFAARGRAKVDVSFLLPALRLEGGPLPDVILPDAGPEAVAISGYLASNAGLPAPEGAPTVRLFQLRQLRISLPWACRELDIEPPDVPYAQMACDALEGDVASGRISGGEWRRAVEEVLVDAYLAADDPRAGSGKGGDETEWRWAREAALDLVPRHGPVVLDVGCANGYLMESHHRWGAERGIDVEPFGLDISWRMVAEARRRLPHWADRIWTGDVLTWAPRRRFDVVHMALDCAEPARRRELVDVIRDRYLAPTGALVLRPDRERHGHRSPADQLRALGVEPDGVIAVPHPTGPDVRRSAWVRARPPVP